MRRGSILDWHDTCLGVVFESGAGPRAGAARSTLSRTCFFEECPSTTSQRPSSRIGDTIGDKWPLVAIDLVHRGKMAREWQTFSENQKHFTYHENAIRHRGSLERLSACVNATAASPLGDVRGITRPIAPDAAPMTLRDCGVCRDLPLRDLRRLQREQAAEARDRVCARSKRPGP